MGTHKRDGQWPRLLWVLFGIALLSRLTILCVTGHLLTPETWEYETIATNLLSGRGFVYDQLGIPYASFTGPIYPGWCALVYRLTGHNQCILVLAQAILSSFIPLVVAAIGHTLFDQRAGFYAGLFTALHPGLLIYTTKLHPLVIEALLFSLIGLGALRLRQRPSWLHRCWVGAALGLTILSRPTALVLIPVLAGWLLSHRPPQWRQALRTITATLLIAVGVVLPWTVRNYLIHHKILLVQSTAGQSFWKGNNPRTISGNLDMDGRDLFSTMPRELRDRLKSTKSELEHDRLFWEESRHYVTQHPGAFMRLLGKKLMAFWWFSPTTGSQYSRWYLVGYQWWYAVFLGLVVYGGWNGFGHSTWEIRHGVWLLILICLTISVGQSLFYVEGRHRWAVEPLLLVFAGEGLAGLIRRYSPVHVADSC